MPYVVGESLRQRLERERQLPLDDALRIARQVLAALGYAHAQGIVHRDIKPENILLQGDQAMVADFGIARALSTAGGERLTATGLALGTPTYMSPEQAAGEDHLDGRSDLYSLGCVLYEMVAGEPPFTGRTPQVILAKRLVEPVPHLSTIRDVPESIERAIARALARSPADRFATAAQFADALEARIGRRCRVLSRARTARSDGGRWWIPLGVLALLAARSVRDLAVAPPAGSDVGSEPGGGRAVRRARSQAEPSGTTGWWTCWPAPSTDSGRCAPSRPRSCFAAGAGEPIPPRPGSSGAAPGPGSQCLGRWSGSAAIRRA